MVETSNYIDDALWSKDPKKIESREQTIILPAQQIFGKSLPPDKQYWAMCSSYFNNEGKTTGELHQMLDAGLITSDQFYGVDNQQHIIDKNKEYYPDINWICNDFVKAMKKASIEGTFNPAIINLDNMRQYKKATKYLKKLLSFIDYNVFGELLVISNIMLNNPRGNHLKVDSIKIIVNYLLKIYSIPDHWTIYPQYYEYDGTGDRSRTIMGTLLFIKSKHKEIKITKGRRMSLTKVMKSDIILVNNKNKRNKRNK